MADVHQSKEGGHLQSHRASKHSLHVSQTFLHRRHVVVEKQKVEFWGLPLTGALVDWRMTSALSGSGSLESASGPLVYRAPYYSPHLSIRSSGAEFGGTAQVRSFFFFHPVTVGNALANTGFSRQFCSLASLISGQTGSDLWNYYCENKLESLG